MEKQVVFDKYWFNKHQKKLIWLANSWFGKYIFRFQKMGHNIEHKIVKITPNSVGELLSIKNKRLEIKEHFFNRNEYAKKLYWYLLPVWYAMHIWDYFAVDHFQLAPKLNFGFDTLTISPGSISSNNPMDSRVEYFKDNSSWATIIAGTGNFGSGTEANSGFISIFSSFSANLWKDIQKSIFCFDTSSLTSNATISSAIMSLYGVSKSDSFSPTIAINIDVYTSNPTSTSSHTASDFSKLGSVSQTGSPISYSSWLTAGYNDFTFNSTGEGNISLIGISKFGCRNANYDVLATSPNYSSNSNTSLTGYFSENATNKPKLVITFTLPILDTGFFNMF